MTIPPIAAQTAVSGGEVPTRHRRVTGLVVGLCALIAVIIASLAIGTRDVSITTVVGAVSGTITGPDADVVLTLRLPRTVLGLLAGAALGVAGAIIQAVTRNPLADPGILGVNSGAAFAVALAVGVAGITDPLGYVWFAFAGALVTTVMVYLIGAAGRGPVTPARVTLAGVALGAVLTGITTAMMLADPAGFNAMRAWDAGSLADRGWSILAAVAPFVIVGLLLAGALGKPLNAIALGDDLAHALGAKVIRTRILALLAITLLAGAATAMAGPIAFVGLMIPHLARWIVGPDQRWIIAYCVLLAPLLLLSADILGRVLLKPGELQVGIVTAFIGAPVLIALVRRQRVSGL